MDPSSLSRAEHFRRFSEELDALATRSLGEPPLSADQIDTIFAEHEAECLGLERAERETDIGRKSVGRRV